MKGKTVENKMPFIPFYPSSQMWLDESTVSYVECQCFVFGKNTTGSLCNPIYWAFSLLSVKDKILAWSSSPTLATTKIIDDDYLWHRLEDWYPLHIITCCAGSLCCNYLWLCSKEQSKEEARSTCANVQVEGSTTRLSWIHWRFVTSKYIYRQY